jgi:hypothetical protein
LKNSSVIFSFSFLIYRDGTISLEELANFIFPEGGMSLTDAKKDPLAYEPGIIYDVARKVSFFCFLLKSYSNRNYSQALMQTVSSVAAQGSDDLLLGELANLAKVRETT